MTSITSIIKTSRPPRVLFTGGGTGGHVYPAIAVADAVRQKCPDAVVAFAGSPNRIEWTAVPAAGYPIYSVSVQGLMRSFAPANILENIKLPFVVGKGVREALRLIDSFDADVAVGTGGYVSAPVIWAAHKKKRPVVIQEQNAHVGLTNKFLARFADRIHTAFTETLSVFPADRTTVSGNPTRKGLAETSKQEARAFFEIESGQRVLIILGGSGGSRAINETLERQLPDFLYHKNLVVIWQTGAKYYDRLKAELDGHPRLRLLKFIDRMDFAYAAADLAICRSGALTCSELMITGTPSILIPSPNVAEDHQTRNAESMESTGAARLMPESRIRSQLYDVWEELWEDEKALAGLSTAALNQATPDAASRIADDVLKLSGRYNA
jgi:UDP-N-acetylglucosamine--N-acetylmuramyl-(pentapeptide) pyrophosphoryl-undecaprenol N-acetylglucosamine transferase